MSKEFNDVEFKKWLDAQPKKMIVAKTIIRSDSNKILLAKPSYKKTWMLPGGGVDSGESPEQAVLREVKEELGLELNQSDFKLAGSIYKKEDDSLFLIYEYLIKINECTAFRLPKEEVTSLAFYDENEVIDLLPSYYQGFWASYTAN